MVDSLDVSDSRLSNVPRRYNAAPSQELLVIRQNHKTKERSLDLLKWGLIPHWCSDPRGGRRPINAKAESVSKLPSFKDAYAQRRCIVPVDGFFEWRAIKGVGRRPSVWQGCGRTGVIRTQKSGSAPLPSSRCPRTNWWVKYTIECQRSSS